MQLQKDIQIKYDSHRATMVRFITAKKTPSFSDWLTGNIHKYQICTLVQKSVGYALRYFTHRFYKVLYLRKVGTEIFLSQLTAQLKKYVMLLSFFFLFANLYIHIQEK